MGQTQTGSRKAESYNWGIEIECFLPRRKVRQLSIQIGSYHHGHPLPAPFPQGWTAERDGSLRTDRHGYIPVEIVSPILQGRAGIEQVKQVTKLLRELEASVNPTCGMHIHIGARSVAGENFTQVAEWIAKLLYQTSMHETALYASTGTHRRENGSYARSVKRQQQAADKVRKASESHKSEALRDVIYGLDRYHTLNLTNLFTSKGTVEFRFPAGTTEATKMVGHICTCLALAERATETTRMDWESIASEKTYATQGRGLRELNRLLYLTGWTLGRREVGQPEVHLAGWIAGLEDLKPVKRELKRLARKYDQGAA